MALTLTKSADIQGLHLVGSAGVRLGTVREAYINLASGQVEFLIVDAGGLLGGTGKYHPIPWSGVRFDPIAKEFQADLSKDKFKGAPSYDREQLASPGYGWSEQAERYFAAPDRATAESLTAQS